jgi:hypothetical protein
MTMKDRLGGVEEKIKRAKKHIQDLDVAVKAFFATKPYVVEAKRDSKTRRPIYYLSSVRDVPPEIAVIAGDTVQSLRSALDHLAYQLVLVGTGQPGPFFYVYFPIFDSAEKYEAGKLGQVKGMRKDAIDAIDAIKPYNGGNDTLWRLHRLNQIDKHRLLIAAGSTFESVDIGGDMIKLLEKAAGEPLGDFSEFSLHIRPADKMFPLKAGDELFIGAPDDEVDKNKQFTFQVSLNESGIVENEPILRALQDMIDLVDGLIPAFGVLPS